MIPVPESVGSTAGTILPPLFNYNMAPSLEITRLHPRFGSVWCFFKFYTVQYRKRRYFPHIFINVAPMVCVCLFRGLYGAVRCIFPHLFLALINEILKYPPQHGCRRTTAECVLSKTLNCASVYVTSLFLF